MPFDKKRFLELLQKNIFLSPEEKEALQRKVDQVLPSRKHIFLQMLEDAEDDQKLVLSAVLEARPTLIADLKKKHQDKIRAVWNEKEQHQKTEDQQVLDEIESQFFQ